MDEMYQSEYVQKNHLSFANDANPEEVKVAHHNNNITSCTITITSAVHSLRNTPLKSPDMPFEENNANAAQSEAIALMKKRLSGFETEEGRLKGLSYVPLCSDEVVISTSPKAGTTWMQQVRDLSESFFLSLWSRR
jgi:hypothetical protein